MIDYSEKIKTHDEYIRVINLLEKETKSIEVVIIDGRNKNDFIKNLAKNIVSKKKTTYWWGNSIASGLNNIYKIKPSKKVFELLRKYENFYKVLYDKNGVYDYEITDFGIDDIAFYDEKKELLLCTTTHEGTIYVRDDFLKIL